MPGTVDWARDRDAEGIARAIDQTYGWGVEENAARFSGWVEHIGSRLGHHRVLKENGIVVAVCRAGARRLRFGSTLLTSVEVAEISVIPSRQGQGLGSALMADFLALARHQGAVLLRLNARNRTLLPFYERFGFFEFPRLAVKIGLDRAPNPSASIRPFAVGDAPECAALHNQTGAAFVGSLVWDPGQGAWEHPCRLVYQDGSQIAGYAYGGDSFSSTGWLDGRTDVLIDLMEGLMQQAVAGEKASVEVRLPQDREMVRALEASGFSVNFTWHTPDEDLNLLCIPDTKLVAAALSLDGVDGALASEVARRVFSPGGAESGGTASTSGAEIWGTDNLDLTQYPLDRPLPSD